MWILSHKICYFTVIVLVHEDMNMLLDEKAIAGNLRTERSCESCRELLGVFTVILPFVGKVREGDCNGNKNILIFISIFISIFIPPKTKDFRVRNQAFHWWIEIINVKKNDKT